jgi:hypothetical protein
MKLLAYSSNIETPIDYQNTFNLALYHLAAAHPEESDRRYTSNLTAPIEWLQIAIAPTPRSITSLYPRSMLQNLPPHSRSESRFQSNYHY